MELKNVFFNAEDFNPTSKTLGEGTFGRVFLVKNPKKKKYIAKSIKIEDGFNGNDQMTLIQESITFHKLHHPSIIKFLGINFQSFEDQEKFSPTILTEFIPYDSLRGLFDNDDEDWNSTKKYITLLGISSAMKYLHKHKILHLQLKPENIIIDGDYYPHISDYGLSKCFPKLQSKSIQIAKRRKIGSLMYMAPEMLEDDEYNEEEDNCHYGAAADVYAFGILAYQIVTGKVPFSEFNKISPKKLTNKVMSGYRPAIDSDISKKMKRLILRCLSQDAEERPTFDEIFSKLSTDFSYFNDEIDEDEINEYLEKLSENEEKITKNKECDENILETQNNLIEERNCYEEMIKTLSSRIQDLQEIKIKGIFIL